MDLVQLKEKARALPSQPGVYLMKDSADQVIYVGKAKRLCARVSQYFQDTASHSMKTMQMVRHVDHFDVIIAASEFEALVLECSLIKKHQPKYNILLKDDKGYPYIRLDTKSEYPQISLANQIQDDDAEYFGPFGSRGSTNDLIDAIKDALKLPHCSLKFPRDIGKKRPCLHYHTKQCLGWCQDAGMKEQYNETVQRVRMILGGNYKELSDAMRRDMLAAADALNFELAAQLRDQLDAVSRLCQKQLVATDGFADVDVIGFEQTQANACFTVLHMRNGNLLDKEFEILPVQDDPQAAVSALLKQYYLARGSVPALVLLPFGFEDSDLLELYLQQEFGKKCKFIVPQRGDKKRLVELAGKNALDEALRVLDRLGKSRTVVSNLSKLLCIEYARRIESYDISNISGTDIVGSMVVYVDGKPHKSAYKRFQIKEIEGQDDYASMYQVLTRRLTRLVNNDDGFNEQPDLLLIDGGVNHANVAVAALDALDLKIPVFGMVKDDRHRTRSLVTPDGQEIRIDHQQSIFSLIGSIQEETHRFAITYHKKLRSRRLRRSALDQIDGVGPTRKEALLKAFGSISAIKEASIEQLQRIVPTPVAHSIFDHFH